MPLDVTVSLRALNILKKSGFVPCFVNEGTRPQRMPERVRELFSGLDVSPLHATGCSTPTNVPGLPFSEG
jgi:hypothetical protein